MLIRGMVVAALLAAGVCVPVGAQVLTKSAIQVDPGNTKQIGATFGYRLSYNCSNTSGPCLNAEVVDLLPIEVQQVSTVPASPTGDVAAIQVTPNFGGSGRTRVRFVMVTPLPAGNSGDLLINVRFPAGSTPNGTTATNTADGINLGNVPGTFTTPPVTVTAVGTTQVNLTKTLTTSPANLDLPETYRLRLAVPNADGALNVTAVGPIVDTLPPGTVFNGATPAADCQPGCVGTTPATVTWTAPCSVPIAPGNQCDILVNVTFPSATFPSGTNVTNNVSATFSALGQPPASAGPVGVTHPVTTFVPNPSMSFDKSIAGNSPSPPTLNQTFSYQITTGNNGNVPIDTPVIIDTLPVEFRILGVTTGTFNGLANFGAGEGIRVSYEKNTALGVFTLWGSSPNTTTNTTLTAPPPGMVIGEYITRVRFELGQAAVGMSANTNPTLTGQIVNPDLAGGPVAIGDSINNCATLAATYTAGPTAVNRSVCAPFVLSGPFVQLNPGKDNLSGGGPFNPGQTVNFRLRVRTDARSSDPVPLADLVATDLLPIDLLFGTFTFDDQGTGLPAPQVFDQIPNFAGTGRTLLRWRWNAGSGNLGVNRQVWINITTTIRNGARNGALVNRFTLDSDSPTLGQRCTGTSQADPLDLDADANTAETLCASDVTINVAPIAQLVSSKTVQATCDAGFTNTSAGVLGGGSFDYRLEVRNVGTVTMQNFVLIDILPAIGDVGVRDTTPRGSQFTPQLVSPIIPPPGTTLYYSLSGNPCRGEVGGPTTACDVPNWTTVPPTPISAARSFKVEFGNRQVAPFDALAFNFRMVAPANLTAGLVTFNSFAYQTDRQDGIGSLAAEPQKVGVSLGTCPAASLGDFVWVDTNTDGQQNDGATGVNGVFAQLFTPGVDGLIGTPDDVLDASTITQNGPGGDPGWYQFPGLVAGTPYRVCFDRPAGFAWTSTDQGADAGDSDVSSSTNCAPPVVLAVNESNQTIDAGLVRPLLADAALGNYTFFDADNDGIQDGPLDHGLNGTLVSLYADSGNNVPEPGAADGAPIAQTLTANDIHGIPGYYRFDGLTPGIPYFVQFTQPTSTLSFTTANAGGDDTLDSDAGTGGISQIVTLASGEYNPTIDAGFVLATGPLALGNQVWQETDNDGIFEPQNGEAGIDGVRVDLYVDQNNDGNPSASEYRGTTSTQTISGFAGIYRFDNLPAGNFIVVIPASNAAGLGALVGLTTATGNDPAPDPDDDTNGDDNGSDVLALVTSRPVTLTNGGEPTADDGDANTNMTVDFGFISDTTANPLDFGDNPDGASATALGNYQTTAADNGPSHVLPLNGPFFGDCVDADTGLAHNLFADADDVTGSAIRRGTCSGADDEDGITLPAQLIPGQNAAFGIRLGPLAGCVVNAWVDFDRDGQFGAGEQIATGLNLAASGTTGLNPLVPPTAVPGVTYARFRCGSGTVPGPNGPDTTGEVEDYRVTITGQDLGDNPSTYATAISDNGARHAVIPGDPLRLGACVDLEGDGAPNGGATGDDAAQGQQGAGLCFDDEDGVGLNTNIRACASNSYTVTANRPGRLDAFIDFNANGTYAEAGEKIADNVAVAAGVNTLTFIAPCGAAAGVTHGRFRLSSSGGLSFTGPAADGEVEDYVVGVIGADFGDAMTPFPTSVADNGAFHSVDPVVPMFLGACVDSESDGVPSIDADGDDAANSSNDVGTCAGNDDEDGITLPAALTACATQNAQVTANVGGLLDAWIDFNRDNDWNDPGERIANGQVLVAGANTLTIATPCNASPGTTNLRLRFSTAGTPAPTGAAADGEVEDHQVPVFGTDFGDAPDTFGTLLASNGARHTVNPDGSMRLGACVDTELDALPVTTVMGDDLSAGTSTGGTCLLSNDDEDGVTVSGNADLAFYVIAGGPSDIPVTYTNLTGSAANLCGYIDFDGNGTFGAGEFAGGTALAGVTNGSAVLTFNVPINAVNSGVFVRFRMTSAACAPTGSAPDGEVEDYRVDISHYDLGDLPDAIAGTAANDYRTLRADGGARHLIVPGLHIGTTVDAEFDGNPGLDADGDDAAGLVADDEDGITFPPGGYELGSPARAFATATNGTGLPATLCGFIDWNNDGDFADTSETASVGVPAGSIAMAFTLNFGLAPLDAAAQLYGRFRLSTAIACADSGDALDGEVEDYRIDTTTNGALSLGNLVFEDLDNDGTADVGEPGIAGIVTQLYSDENQDCVADGASLLTTTTDASGNYAFADLLPGFYLVGIVPPAEFLGSTGTGRVWAATGPFEPALDPDNNQNNDDNGTLRGAEITSCAIELRAKDEPVNDGDADFNSNLTVDFGLVRNFDLALIKRRAAGQSNLINYGQSVQFTITVYNQGTIPATNITVVDYIPNGLALNDADWTAFGPSEARIVVPGPLAVGASIDVPISLVVTPGAMAGVPILNVAEIVEASDGGGVVRPDKDSTPDGNGGNDGNPIDDETGNGDNDEDDQDFAGVLLPNNVPTLSWLGLMLMMVLVMTAARRRLS